MNIQYAYSRPYYKTNDVFVNKFTGISYELIEKHQIACSDYYTLENLIDSSAPNLIVKSAELLNSDFVHAGYNTDSKARRRRKNSFIYRGVSKKNGV